MKTIKKNALVFLFALCSLAILCGPALAARTNADTRKALRVQENIQKTIKAVVPTYVKIGGGSGVMISPDGYFITNFHVVARLFAKTNTTTVMLPSGKTYSAKKVGVDPFGDTALCKITLPEKSKEKFPYAKFGDSDKVRRGQVVIAVGNPFGLGSFDGQPTVTVGVVSANNRFINAGRGTLVYGDAVMTDLSINPGNSGGPLFDINGNLLGINGLIYSRYGHKSHTGVGYAVSINQIKKFLPLLKKNETVYHGKIDGITFSGKPSQNGAAITGIKPNSPAAKAGFKTGDIVMEVNGKKITTYANFFRLVKSQPEKTRFKTKVKRGGKSVTISFTSDRIPLQGQKTISINPNKPTLGISIAEEKGSVRIIGIVAGGGAAKAGLRVNDIIKKINGTPITSIAKLKQALAGKKVGDSVRITVKRGKKTLTVTAKLMSAKDTFKK